MRDPTPASGDGEGTEAAGVDQLWLPVTAFLAIAGTTFLLVGYRIDDPALGSKLLLTLITALVSYYASRRGVSPRLSWAVTGVVQATAISSAGMMLTYTAASLGGPLADPYLQQFDRAIGYNSADYAAFVRVNPCLSNLLYRCYFLIFGLPILIIFPLAAVGQFRQINRYLLATLTSLVFTAATFACFPALTAWDHLGIDLEVIRQYGHLPDRGGGWVRDLIDIRAGHGFLLHSTSGSGLTAFPSYHCVAGVLFVWAIWPVKWLRLPALTVSTLLIAAAPIFGGHYLADLFGGSVVAVVSAVAAERLELVWQRTRTATTILSGSGNVSPRQDHAGYEAPPVYRAAPRLVSAATQLARSIGLPSGSRASR